MVLAVLVCSYVKADFAASREFQLKAAFLYNFLMFVDWPEGKMADSNSPITIGIIGDDKFKDAFEPIKDKLIGNKKVVVIRFKPFEELKKTDKAEMDKEIEAIRRCHLLYICRSEEASLEDLMNLTNGCGVLTVAGIEKFVESGGGIINFIMEENKVRFEINLNAARRANLKIRSQLLKLAKKVIGTEQIEVAKK
jgi:hypothetical protein